MKLVAYFNLKCLAVSIAIIFLGLHSNPAHALVQVGLYDVFETSVINTKTYSNPFDFRVIELKATFTSPSGRKFNFFGFYDGDGKGGLTGSVWKMRFMPDQVGIWNYIYTWTDGTPGGSGSFDVIDTGLPGPLKVARDNPWFFEDARGIPVHWRGYSMHLYLEWGYGRGIYSDTAWADLNDKINAKVADRGYNFLMLGWPVFTKSYWPPSGSNAGHHLWQQSGSSIDFSRYYIPQWQKVEQTLKLAAERNVYIFQFLALVDQYTSRPDDNQMTSFLRYMAARLGPYWNNFGYSATWEYQDIWSHNYANSVMTRLHDNLTGLPIPPLLSIHDHSNNLFTGWLDFSMRQLQSKDIFTGNIHGGGIEGGVGSVFLNKPIIGSEDIWETGENGSPNIGNSSEVRRAAWGIQMAGVMPVYMEYTGSSREFKGGGEPEVRRMWDFFYSKTHYRQYQQLNSLVSISARQIASGIPGQEYLIYDEDGGSISINLSGTSGTFSILWFDPKTGIEKRGEVTNGGAYRILTSPFIGDAVLLLVRVPVDTIPPAPPAVKIK